MRKLRLFAIFLILPTVIIFNQLSTASANSSSSPSPSSSWLTIQSGIPINVSNFVPGQSGVGNFTVTNNNSFATAFSLQITNLQTLENTCNSPEKKVDSTCGANQGELQNFLILKLTDVTATSRQIFSGTIAQWASKARTDSTNIDKNKTRKYRLDYTLPAATGNIVQTDSVKFNLQFTLEQVTNDNGHHDDCKDKDHDKKHKDSCDDDHHGGNDNHHGDNDNHHGDNDNHHDNHDDDHHYKDHKETKGGH